MRLRALASCPNLTITRGRWAALLVRALNLPPGRPARFVDDDGSIFELEIEALTAARITLGCNPPANDRFCPAGSSLMARPLPCSIAERP